MRQAIAIIILGLLITGCRTAEQQGSVVNVYGGGGVGNPTAAQSQAVVWNDARGREQRGIYTGQTDADGNMLVLNAAGGIAAVAPGAIIALPASAGGGVNITINNNGANSNQGKTVPVDIAGEAAKGATVEGLPLP